MSVVVLCLPASVSVRLCAGVFGCVFVCMLVCVCLIFCAYCRLCVCGSM